MKDMINKFDTTTQEVLQELEKTQKEFWNVSRATGEFLNILTREQNAQNVLEIGTSNGYSGIWIGKAVKETGGKLKTIEFWEKRFSIAQENFKKCGVDDCIEIVQGSALEVLELLPEDYVIDFAFIDANKTEYVDYFKLIDKHLRVGGLVACDNVLSHEEKCKPFIDEINSRPNYHNVVLRLPAGLSLARKLS